MTEARFKRPLSRFWPVHPALLAGAVFGLFAPVIDVFAGLALLMTLARREARREARGEVRRETRTAQPDHWREGRSP